MTCEASPGAPAIFQSFIWIDTGSMPSRKTTKESACHRGGCQAEQEHGQIERNVGLGGELIRGQPGHQHSQKNRAQTYPESTTDGSQNQILAKKLAKELPSRRAQRSTNGGFSETSAAFREHQVSYIRAGDQQHKTNCSHEQP